MTNNKNNLKSQKDKQMDVVLKSFYDNFGDWPFQGHVS